MKIHSLLVEILIFLVVILFFICPPLFVAPSTTGDSVFFEWGFPLSRLILAIFALLLYLLYHNSEKSKENILGRFRIITTVCWLFTCSFFMNFLAYVFPAGVNETVNISVPDSVISWIFCIMNFCFAAFYEEVIYRFYFTDKLISIITGINDFFNKKIFRIICEILGCCIFALGHRYLGFLAVCNAAIAHFILRNTYKKTGSIIPGFIAHFIYNVTSLILL